MKIFKTLLLSFLVLSQASAADLLSSQNFQVSRNSGGAWITLQLEASALVSQINFRAIGSGQIRIYGLNMISENGKSTAVSTSQINLEGLQVTPLYLGLSDAVTHVQILAEAFRSNMILGVDVLGQATQSLPPPPPSTGQPLCQIAGSGLYGGNSWLYRGGYNDEVYFATDDMNNMIQKMSELEQAGLCRNEASACEFAGSGAFYGQQWAYRLAIQPKQDGFVFFANDTFEQMIFQIDQLTQQRICKPVAKKCDLAGPGAFNGASWDSRLSVGDQIIYASDDQSKVINFIRQLRSRGFCQ